MPKIRIDLEASVINGQTLTFQSPADCSQIEGLIIYYPEGNATTSKDFAFVDAHGVDVGSGTISLFAENSLVKVVLDVDGGKAYVQNADTNAYLEGRFDEKPNLGQNHTDNAVAHVKDVPADSAPYAKVLEIGGMTYKVNVGTEEEPVYELRSAPVTKVESVGVNLFGGDALADKLVEVADATKNEAAGTVTFNANKVSGVIVYDNFKENTQYTFLLYGRNTSTTATNLRFSYSDGSTSSPIQFAKEGEDSYAVYTSAKGKTVTRLYGSNQHGSTILYYDKCGIFEGVLTEADFKPYHRETLPIPEAVQSLDGYGEGNPDNAEEYNAIICKDGKWKYSHKGDIDNNVWTPLATPEMTDISDILSDNSIGVESNGTITMLNEYGYDVPNTVEFFTGNNELIAADEFVGDLVGTAARAVCDKDGNPISGTYAKYDSTDYSLKAKANGQDPNMMLLRNSKLVSDDFAIPLINGSICWQYE